jgi:hypothetical protein
VVMETISTLSGMFNGDQRLHSHSHPFTRLEGALDPWIESLFHTLLEHYPLSLDVRIQPKGGLPEPRVYVKKLHSLTVENGNSPFVSDAHSYCATVKANERITDPYWSQDVRNIVFHLKSESQ